MFWHVANYGLPDGLPRVNHVGLVEQPKGHVVAVSDSPAVWLHALGQQLEQSRLAIAVAADDSDSVALVYAYGNLVEDLFGRKFERDRFSAEQVSH